MYNHDELVRSIAVYLKEKDYIVQASVDGYPTPKQVPCVDHHKCKETFYTPDVVAFEKEPNWRTFIVAVVPKLEGRQVSCCLKAFNHKAKQNYNHLMIVVPDEEKNEESLLFLLANGIDAELVSEEEILQYQL